MAYLIFIANGEEFDRRDLSRPLVIGRAADCDVSIHDIILSRHHCRIELQDDGRWVATDLQSKNGTQYLGQSVERHVLKEGDELRLGRTRMTFRGGEYVASKAVQKRRLSRAVDPKEALAGTVSGMVVCEPGETHRSQGMPFPQPRPADPSAYVRDDVYGMISQIISNSWDSIQQQASEPTRRERAMPVPGVTQMAQASSRPKQHVSLELQAQADREKTPPPTSTTIAANSTTFADDNSIKPLEINPPELIVESRPHSLKRWHRVRAWLLAAAALGFILIVLMLPSDSDSHRARRSDQHPPESSAPSASPAVADMNATFPQNTR